MKAIKAVFALQVDASDRVREFLKALTCVLGTVIDLTLRQDHAGMRTKELLGTEDARRLVFQAFLVMTEIDSAMRELDARDYERDYMKCPHCQSSQPPTERGPYATVHAGLAV